MIRANCLQNMSESLQKFVLSYVFPLFMPRSESLPSLFAHSLFFKELPEFEPFAPVALEKSDREQFSQVAYDKKAIGVIPSFS